MTDKHDSTEGLRKFVDSSGRTRWARTMTDKYDDTADDIWLGISGDDHDRSRKEIAQSLRDLAAKKDKEINRLRALLTEAADELAFDCHYQYLNRDKYPDEMRRYNREMDLVSRMTDTTQFNPDDLIRQRMEYATEEHAKLLVENADLRNEITRLRLVCTDFEEGKHVLDAEITRLRATSKAATKKERTRYTNVIRQLADEGYITKTLAESIIGACTYD